MAVEGRIPFRGYGTWYRVVGDYPRLTPPPIVCLHGGPGSTHLELTPLERLADGRAVVFYDQIGGGNSSRPSDPSLWSIDLFVAELAAIREALGLETIHLFGASWGGMLALEYALTKPKGLASLVLSSTLSSAQLWVRESRRLRADLPTQIQDVLNEHERNGTTSSPAYREATLAFYRRYVCRLDPWPEIVQRVQREIRSEIYETMWGPSAMHPTGRLKDWDVTSRLGEIRVPALVTCGRYDEATPLQARTIAHGIHGAKFALFDESAHMALFEEPDRYLCVVRDFLAGVDLQLPRSRREP